MQFSTKCWSEHILSAYKATKDLKLPLYMIFKLNSERKQSTDSFCFNAKEFIRISCIVAKCWKIAFHLQADWTQ